jgi:hypothetical protein
MIKTFDFSFDELVIDPMELKKLLGFDDGILPEPFDGYLEEALAEANSLACVKASYRVVDNVKVDRNTGIITAEGTDFKVGRMILGELRGSEKLAFFVCTAGKDISEKSVRLLKGENPVLGYVYDLLGSAIAESAGDKMQEFLKIEMAESGWSITNRYSPGYCNWSVSDQHNLFSLFETAPCGVTLTRSALMHPVKSISGVIGIGSEVKYRDYQCELCKHIDCIYRRVRGSRH